MTTRYTVLKEMIKRLGPLDISIFCGKGICEESNANDREENIYIMDDTFPIIPFTTGIAMSTKKRIFLFTSDNVFLRDLSSVAQMSVSECKNLYYILLTSGYHLEAGGHSNIFNSISHPQGVLFRLGFTSFVLDPYFEGSRKSELKGLMDTLVGPVAITINVSNKSTVRKGLNHNLDFYLNRLKTCLLKPGTSLYSPPELDNVIQGEMK